MDAWWEHTDYSTVPKQFKKNVREKTHIRIMFFKYCGAADRAEEALPGRNERVQQNGARGALGWDATD